MSLLFPFVILFSLFPLHQLTKSIDLVKKDTSIFDFDTEGFISPINTLIKEEKKLDTIDIDLSKNNSIRQNYVVKDNYIYESLYNFRFSENGNKNYSEGNSQNKKNWFSWGIGAILYSIWRKFQEWIYDGKIFRVLIIWFLFGWIINHLIFLFKRCKI